MATTCQLRKKRPILIDRQNVALYETRVMDPAQCLLVVNYFRKRGHETYIIFPRNVTFDRCSDDESRLLKKFTILTPARTIEGINEVSNDDLFLLRHAVELGACIVSLDQFRKESKFYPEFRDVIRYRILQYTIIDSSFLVAEDPLGKNTRMNLDDILHFPPGEYPPSRSDVIQELLANTPDVDAVRVTKSGNSIADPQSTEGMSSPAMMSKPLSMQNQLASPNPTAVRPNKRAGKDDPEYVWQEYTYPPDYESRDNVLSCQVANSFSSGDYQPGAYSVFSALGARYMNSEFSSLYFYSRMKLHLGSKFLHDHFADIVALLPDIKKQHELRHFDRNVNTKCLTPCDKCFQLVFKTDLNEHKKSHV